MDSTRLTINACMRLQTYMCIHRCRKNRLWLMIIPVIIAVEMIHTFITRPGCHRVTCYIICTELVLPQDVKRLTSFPLHILAYIEQSPIKQTVTYTMAFLYALLDFTLSHVLETSKTFTALGRLWYGVYWKECSLLSSLFKHRRIEIRIENNTPEKQ